MTTLTRPAEFVTVQQLPDGLFHWQVVTPTNRTVSHECWPTQEEASQAAQRVAPCYSLPVVLPDSPAPAPEPTPALPHPNTGDSGRVVKAAYLVADGKVHKNGAGYLVDGTDGRQYHATADHCDCPDATFNHATCKHMVGGWMVQHAAHLQHIHDAAVNRTLQDANQDHGVRMFYTGQPREACQNAGERLGWTAGAYGNIAGGKVNHG